MSKAVTAPRELKIKGQDHMLAYITRKEAEVLKARGGSGRKTRYGIPSYEDGGGDGNGDGGGDANSGGDANDNGTSNSEASSQDAAGGNAGQGAGPTGAGAGATGETGPGNSEGLGLGASNTTETDTGPDQEDADQGRAMASTPPGTFSGFSPVGIQTALSEYDAGRLSIGQLATAVLGNVVAPPGVQLGYNMDELGNKTEAISVSPMGLGFGLAGLATGVPGLGTALGYAGNALGQNMGVGNVIGHASNETMSPDSTGNSVDDYSLLNANLPSGLEPLPTSTIAPYNPAGGYVVVNGNIVPRASLGLLG